jgi:hypothetical protein
MNNFILFLRQKTDLVLGLDESVDVLLPVTGRATLDVVLELSSDTPAAGGVGELEGPQEVGSLLEGRANSVDLVDQILHADDAVLAESLLNDGVVGKRDSLLVDLTVSSLVDELSNGGQVGVTEGNVGLDDSQKLGGSLGDSHKDTVVDLVESQELQDLSGLGGHLGDTLDSDNEHELGLGGDVEGAVELGLSSESDLLSLGLSVLLDVLLGSGEDDLVLLGVSGLLLGSSSLLGGSDLVGVLSLLQESLGNENVILGGHGSGRHFRCVDELKEDQCENLV